MLRRIKALKTIGSAPLTDEFCSRADFKSLWGNGHRFPEDLPRRVGLSGCRRHGQGDPR